MEGKKYSEQALITIFLIIIYFVGILGHSFEYTQSIMFSLTPFTLLLTGTIVLVFVFRNSDVSFVIWFAIVYLITFSLEVVGVKTGMIFGNYKYGDVLGLKLLDTPLIIGFNWVITVLGALNLAILLTKKSFTVIFFTGLFAILFDFLLEPVAIKFDYWKWENNVIPIQNYIAWFLIASVAASIFVFLKIEVKNKLALNYLIIQSVFFLILNYTV